MPMNITTASWHTPQSWGSAESLTATQLTNIGENLGFLYAKPWITVWQNTAPTAPTLPITTNLSAANGKTLFATAIGGTIGTNLSASALGSFAVATTGVIATPASLAGLYKVYCQMMVKVDATAHVRVSAILYGSAGTQIGSIAGTWADANSAYNAVSICSFNLPMNAASVFGTVTGIKFIGQAAGAATDLVGYDLNGLGPGSTPKQLNTFATFEYLGVSSTGSF